MRAGSFDRDLSVAIASVYDAGLDWHAWPVALDRIADLLDAAVAQFGSYNADTHRLQTVMPRIDPDYARNFVEYWASRNTIWQRSSTVPVGEVMRPEMFLPKDEWKRTDFFNEWYRPQRLDAMIGANVLVENPVSTVISVLRKDDFASAEVKIFELLIPHVQRAVQLQLRLAFLEDQQTGSTEILNRLRQGVLLVDEAGKIQFANRAAERILTEPGGLRSRGGMLQAGTTEQTAQLQRAIASCVEIACTGTGTPGRRIRVARGDTRRPLNLLIIPLRPQAPWTRLYRPAAILFITDPECAIAIRSDSLQDEFRLTRTEAALALEIVTGQGLQAAAGRLKITLTTARTHLAHIFRKTGTRRQAELVRIILQSDSGVDS